MVLGSKLLFTSGGYYRIRVFSLATATMPYLGFPHLVLPQTWLKNNRSQQLGAASIETLATLPIGRSIQVGKNSFMPRVLLIVKADDKIPDSSWDSKWNNFFIISTGNIVAHPTC